MRGRQRSCRVRHLRQRLRRLCLERKRVYAGRRLRQRTMRLRRRQLRVGGPISLRPVPRRAAAGDLPNQRLQTMPNNLPEGVGRL
jgi:hypothetical protein